MTLSLGSMQIYHNPRCSKSRQTLALIKDSGIEPEIVEYLKTPLDEKQIQAILEKLAMSADQLIRNKETLYKELSLKGASETALISAMAKHPSLIERPIVVSGNKAVLGRPPENVQALF